MSPRPAGTYTVTITDSKGCTATSSVTITEPASALTATMGAPTHVLCFGQSTGAASVTAAGGTPAYTYAWSNASSASSITAQPAGAYTVTITDSKGCTTTASVTITQPPTPITIGTAVATIPTCVPGNDATITLTVSGGVSPYTYSKTNLVGSYVASNVLTGFGVGAFTVYAKDANGCTTSTTVNIVNAALPNVTASVTSHINCFGGSNGAASATATSGTTPYTYAWAAGGYTTSSISNIVAGTYTVTVTDNQNCTTSTTVTITQPSVLTATIGAPTHVNCFAQSTGAATVTAGGGTSPYTYSWNNSAGTSAAASNLAAGTYVVTITDSKGCTATSSVTITEPASALTATTGAPTHVLCFGQSTGAASVTAAGGTPAYTYAWSNAVSASSITAQPAGAYIVTITDSKGCTSTASVTITQPPTPVSITNAVGTVPTCNPGNDATITITASGGVGPYTYSPTNAAGSYVAGNVLAGFGVGTFTVYAKDANGCTTSTAVNIVNAALPNVTASVTTHVSCFGGSNGSASATASGGTTPYNYLWAGTGITSSTITNLTANTYTVTVTDNQNCTTTATVTITQPPLLVATMGAPTQVNCFAQSTGAAAVTASGGTSPYTYAWNNNAGTSASATNLAAGTYVVTITDNKGCTATASVTITQPAAPLTATMGLPTHVLCFGDNTGAANVIAGGGTPAYTYLWSTGSTSNSISALPALAYTVTITDSKGCTSTSSITITQPPTPVVISNAVATVPTCSPGNDATITLTASGGVGPYTYSQTNIVGSYAASNVLTGFGVGTFTVFAKDANGCTTSTVVTIANAALPTVTASISTHVSCFAGADGAAIASGSGGTSPYTYAWSNASTGTNLNAVAAGSYVVTITDSKNCTATTSVNITEPTQVIATINASSNVNCFGQNTGTASASATGGTPGYTYQWLPVGGTNSNASALAANTYTITVTDNKGCTTTASVTITQPTTSVAANIASTTHVLCNSDATGAASVAASGGTSPYTYAWNNSVITTSNTGLVAGTYSVTVTDALGCTSTTSVTITEPPTKVGIINAAATIPTCNPGNDATINVVATGGVTPYEYSLTGAAGSYQTNNLLANIGAGTYTVFVKDANGCTTTSIVDVINAAIPLITATVQNNVSCFGLSDGAINTTTTSGTGPFTYAWTPSVATTANATGLAANTYVVVVTDSKNCTNSASATITQPSALTVDPNNLTHVSCFGGANGSVLISVNGGTVAYQYAWSPNTISGDNPTNMQAGTYTVIVTDNNGCTSTASITITQPQQLLAVISNSTPVSCFGGSDGTATVSVSGGTANYTYNWLPTGTSSAATATGLALGTYTVEVTDANSCTTSTTVSITEPIAPLGATLANTLPTCVPGNDAQVTATATGGTTPYEYSLDGISYQASNTFNGLTSSTYTVWVKDARNCTVSTTVTINNQAIPVIVISTVQPVSCFGGNNGIATTTTTNGTAPYNYNWSPTGGSAATAIGLIADTYTVLVTDANGCTNTTSVTIIEPPLLTLAGVVDSNVRCNGGNNASATVTAAGGNGSYTYAWTPSGGTAATATNLAAGSYTATVTDSKGCTSSTSVVITEPTVVTATITNIVHVLCKNGNNGSATVSAGGGVTPYTYQWTNLGTGTVQGSLTQGTYTATVTDANGCTATTTAVITEPLNSLDITSIVTTIPTCVPGNDATATITLTGGTPQYAYALDANAPQASNVIGGLGIGTYTITGSDANGCTTQSTISIVAPAQPLVTISNVIHVDCYGNPTGGATATASNGVSPYTYLWSNGNINATAAGFVAGTYTVTATDNSGCTTTATVTITEPPLLSIAVTSVTNVTIYGLSNGGATVAASAGTPNYTYNLQDSTGSSIVTGNTSGTFSNLYAGTFTATVTDANGCTAQVTFTIIQPPPLILTYNYQIDVLCKNTATGYAAFHITGGTPGYSISLQASGTATQVVDSIFCSGLVDGTYTLTVTDLAGSSTSATFTITEPDSLVINTLTTTPPICNPANSGTITYTAIGGTPSYQYVVTDGLNNYTQNNGNFIQLPAGNYTVSVTDAKNCVYTSLVTLLAPAIPSIVVTGTTDEWCTPASNGTATVQASGGLVPYQYGLSLGSVSTNNVISNLAAGTYTIYVIDSNNCVNSVQAVIAHVPLLYLDSIVTTPASCDPGNDATAEAFITGGTGPFTYNSNGINQASPLFSNVSIGTYAITVSDTRGCSSILTYTIVNFPDPTIGVDQIKNVSCFGLSDAIIDVNMLSGFNPVTFTLLNTGASNSTGAFTGLAIGTYTVQAQDGKGCSTTTSYTITQPTPLQVASIGTTSVTCAGAEDGTLTISGAGGTTPYTYTMANNGASNSTGAFVSLPGNTTYTVTITDAQLCTITSTAFIAEPDPVAINVDSIHHVKCFGGNDGYIKVSATGGTNSYQYSISGQSGSNTSGIFAGLTIGTYTLVATDANNCSISTAVTLTEPPALLFTNAVLTHILCFGGSNGAIAVTAQGGFGAIQYTLPGSGTNNTGTFTSLTAGAYVLTATDAHGCTSTTAVTLTEPPLLQYSIFIKTDVTCFGASDGTAAAVIAGGTSPYSNTLLPNNYTSATPVYNNLGPGTYTITTTDANTCTVSTTFTIIEPLPLVIDSVLTKNITCYGGNDGRIVVSGQGGTLPYSYTILPTFIIDSAGDFNNLFAGVYTILLQDANGCDTMRTFSLSQPPDIVITSLQKQDITCFGDSTGFIKVSAIGGTGALTYSIPFLSWTEPSGQFLNMPAGIYTVNIVDAAGCVKTTVVELTQNPEIILDSVQYTNPTCFGNSDGAIFVSVSGGVGTLTLTLNGVTTTGTGQINGIPAGFYDVLVIDALGCSVDTTLELTQPLPLEMRDSLIGSNACRYNKDVSAFMITTGGTPDYTYYMKPSLLVNNTGIFEEIGAGSYEITVVDRFGCTTTDEFNVGFIGDSLSVGSTVKGVTCEGFGLDGAIAVHIAGGAPPYILTWSTGLEGADTFLNELKPGAYWVTVVDENGCEGADSMVLDYAPCCVVDLPNAFTPNADQLNDIYRPISGAGYQIIRFQIYDRWGNQVFATTDFEKGWDGQRNGMEMDLDTYFVVFSYRCLFDNRTYTITKDVMLLR
jgi:gliding motility-associated-like protein